MEDIFQETVFARKFASNNKITRDKTLKEVKKWFKIKNNESNVLSDDDFSRLWKGLYYCLWMTDKSLIQEEVCEKISNFVHCWDKSLKNFSGFIKSFFYTMRENWFGLDQFRLDKFLMLTRRMNRQILFFLVDRDKNTKIDNDHHWEIYSNIILNELLDKSDNAMGLTFHFVDLIIEELAKVTNGKLATSKLSILIKPFMITFLKTFDIRLKNHIEKNIFVYLMKQNPIVLKSEEQYNAWKRAGRPGNSYLDMELIESDENEEHTQGDQEELVEENEEAIFDPRAGRIDVVLNGIDFEPDLIIKTIKDCLHTINTKPAIFRRGLRLCKSFEQLNQGINPFLKVDIKKQREQIQNNILILEQKNKINLKRKQTNKDIPTSKMRKMENNKKMKNSNRQTKKVNKKMKNNERKMIDIQIDTEIQEENADLEIKMETVDKKMIDIQIDAEIQEENAEIQVKNAEIQVENADIQIENANKQIENVDDINSPTRVEIEKKQNQTSKENIESEFERKKNLNLKKMKILAKKLSKEQALSKQIKKKKLIKKKNLKLSQKAGMESHALMLSETQSEDNPEIMPKDSAKRVSIQLNLNRTQDFSEYCKTLKDNPQIPYDPEKKRCGILKPSITTPTNPFYKPNKKGGKNKNKFRRNAHK